MTALDCALDISTNGIEPTRGNVSAELSRCGVSVDPLELDDAVIKALHLHRWIVEPGHGRSGGKRPRSHVRIAKRGKRRAA